MPNVLILTDGTAQFTASTYAGMERVFVLPWRIQLPGQRPVESGQIKLEGMPASLGENAGVRVLPPSVDDFFHALARLGKQAHEIVVILTSAHLSPVMKNAQKAMQTVHCPAAIHLVDSQNVGAGLGLLVQAAAQAVAQGESGSAVCRFLRGLVPHTYSLFCVQSLTYLAHAGHLDLTQAMVGEMLNLMPFFMLENGSLAPVQKARSSRQLAETVNEFLAEFESLVHVAMVHGTAPFDQEAYSLAERLGNTPEGHLLSEHVLNGATAGIFGPRSLGISVMEEMVDGV
ncbi:MAG: DegV family protein [Chloroflexota bacterium]